ncbi:uncharacterized protein LOC127277222 [Leptopilina boulardi]|uniref:uncharacterized protein LOC127277222 n=1 Tax=Leptopilina boulardi TaxID=63433 RepID=UPI0021F59F6C|nr:uncharacterized protein LOC127277222 [Leptopilina boulardi]
MKIWIILVCLAGITLGLQEQETINNSIPGPRISEEYDKEHDEQGIRRFACPVGFFRLKRFCYYLSAGKSPWNEAHYHCKDRNATLSILDRYGKDKMLRKHLMGEQFMQLDRWIGGIYNYKLKIWTWGTSGKQIDFQSFERQPQNPLPYSCIVMDPSAKYKWKAKSCFESKFYVCEVPAGGIGRRRKKTVDPFAPENQRLRGRKKGKKNILKENKHKKHRQNKGRIAHEKKEWRQQNPNQEWNHGVKLGSRPPSRIRMAPGAMPSDRMRHHPIDRTYQGSMIPRVSQISSQGKEYGAFLGDSPANIQRQQNLADISNALTDFHEQILLKT